MDSLPEECILNIMYKYIENYEEEYELWGNSRELTFDEFKGLNLQISAPSDIAYKFNNWSDKRVILRLARGVTGYTDKHDSLIFKIIEIAREYCNLNIKKENIPKESYYKYDWKKKAKIYTGKDLTSKEKLQKGTAWVDNIDKWKTPSFRKALFFMSISKYIMNTCDNNDTWCDFIVKDFKSGKPYKRKPVNAKEEYIRKSKVILQNRYESSLSSILEINELYRIYIKKHLESINKLKESAKQFEKEDTESIVNRSIITFKQSKVSVDNYLQPNLLYSDSYVFTLQQLLRHIDEHELRIQSLIRKANISLNIINEIEPRWLKITDNKLYMKNKYDINNNNLCSYISVNKS